MRSKIFAPIAILTLISVVFVSGCVRQPIGGERDEHGCLGPAGYTWNQEVSACIREWELNENQREAARKAVDHVGYVKGTTVIGVDVMRCPGCFVVHLEKGKDRIDVTLDNWQIIGRSLTPDECNVEGGRVVNIVGGDACESDESNIGNVTGFISPAICCSPNAEEVRNFEDCVNAEYPVMESYPRQCMTPDGRSFTEEDICVTSNGVSMSLFEAKGVAYASDCVVNGTLKDIGVCNSDTGTWWIDLNIEKTGCSPACVVDIEAKTAEINWRCTGLI